MWHKIRTWGRKCGPLDWRNPSWSTTLLLNPPSPPPPPLKAHRDIILWLVALSCIGETEGPQREPRGVHKGA